MKELLKNKKIMSVVCIPVLVVLFGFSVWAVVDNTPFSITDEPPIVNKVEIVDKTVSDDSQSESTTEPIDNTENKIVLEEKEIIAEKLSSEDIALKNEIAKVAPNAADFRHNMTEKLGEKSYELVCSEVLREKKIKYTNSYGDEFTYYLDTGNISNAVINSAKMTNVTEKISETIAQKIAYEYASSGYGISNYVLDTPTTNEDGYTFIYRRYVSEYSTEDCVGISVGYDGSILEIFDSRDEFIGKDIIVNEAKIKAANEQILASLPNGSYIKKQWIGLGDGRLVMITIAINGETGKVANPIPAIPLE